MWRMVCCTTRGYVRKHNPWNNEWVRGRHSLYVLCLGWETQQDSNERWLHCDVCVSVCAIWWDTDRPTHPPTQSESSVGEGERRLLATNSVEDAQNMLRSYPYHPVCSQCVYYTTCCTYIHTCIHLGSVHCVTREGANAPLTTQHRCLHYYIYQTTTPTTSRLDIPPHYLRACRPFQLTGTIAYLLLLPLNIEIKLNRLITLKYDAQKLCMDVLQLTVTQPVHAHIVQSSWHHSLYCHWRKCHNTLAQWACSISVPAKASCSYVYCVAILCTH